MIKWFQHCYSAEGFVYSLYWYLSVEAALKCGCYSPFQNFSSVRLRGIISKAEMESPEHYLIKEICGTPRMTSCEKQPAII